MFDIRIICAPGDAEGVTTALSTMFATGPARKYPTRDGKRLRLYVTAEPRPTTPQPIDRTTARCLICRTPIGWIDCPTGGWWAHDQHPDDHHDAQPIPAPGTPLGDAATAVDALLATETDHARAARLYQVLVLLSLAEFEIGDGAALVPPTTD